MIKLRLLSYSDIKELIKIAREVNVFKPYELCLLRENLRTYRSSSSDRCVVYCLNRKKIAFAYWEPLLMTDGGWYFSWLAVSKKYQKCGIAKKLLSFIENHLHKKRCRFLLGETSSQSAFKPMRKFLKKEGFRRIAVLKNYYSDGDDNILYCKRF